MVDGIVTADPTHMNLIASEVTRPPKSPALLQQQQAGSSKKLMTASSRKPPPPPRPYPLKRSVSAPVSQLRSNSKPQRDETPLQVKVYDGFGDDGSDDSLGWLERALGDSSDNSAEEKKEDCESRKSRRHRRGRAFSWDGGGTVFKTKTTPSTPATVATSDSSSPESSPEPGDPNCWSMSWKLGGSAPSSKRGKPPKAGKPSPLSLRKKFSRKVASVDIDPPKQQQKMSRSEVHERVSSFLKNGDYGSALALSENILHEDQERYGHHHASVGIALHNIGMVHLHAARYAMSESVFYQSVLVRKNALGPEHLDVAASLTKLATVRLHLQKFEEALSAFLEALRITRKHLGYGHSCVAQLQSHIGCVYYEVGEYMAAQATFEDALDIYRALWASGIEMDVSVVAVTEMLCNIGSIQSKRKNFFGAIASFSEALDLQRRTMGQDHPRVIATLDNLGHAYSKNKDYGQALLIYKEMLRAQVAFYGTYNDECYRTAKKQNLMYEKQKRREKKAKEASKRSPLTPDHAVQELATEKVSPYL